MDVHLCGVTTIAKRLHSKEFWPSGTSKSLDSGTREPYLGALLLHLTTFMAVGKFLNLRLFTCKMRVQK